MTSIALIVAGTALALGLWAFLFRRPSAGIWPRTWIAASVLTGWSVAALALTHRLDDLLGPWSWMVPAAGLGVGVAWLVVTHIGHGVLCRMVPGFLEQVSDLYSLREGDRFATIVGPLTALGIAEELFFRGLVQDRLGLIGGVAIYTGVQLVVGKWALTLAALLGGAVWGLLFWWQGGIVAPVIAHVLWTGTLTLLWPLPGCGRKPDPADLAPLGSKHDPAGERSPAGEAT